MNEPDKVADGPQVLHRGRKLRIVRLSNTRLLVRSAGRWVYSLLLCFCCLLAAVGLWISSIWVYMSLLHVQNPEQKLAGLICGVPFTLFWVFVLVGVVHSLLRMALPRNTIIDLDTSTAEFHQIPGLSTRMALDNVATVDLVMFGGHGVCHLGFTDKQTGRLHSFHWLFGQFDDAIENRDHLLPAARLIATFINKPLESSWGAWGWSLRKGASEAIPADIDGR